MAGRLVHLTARHLQGEPQWAVRLGEDVWTELDVVETGSKTSVNGGQAGGWFGWGRRQDAPLHRGVSSRSDLSGDLSGDLLVSDVLELGTTNLSDKEVETFNREYIQQHPVYRLVPFLSPTLVITINSI